MADIYVKVTLYEGTRVIKARKTRLLSCGEVSRLCYCVAVADVAVVVVVVAVVAVVAAVVVVVVVALAALAAPRLALITWCEEAPLTLQSTSH